MKWVFSSAGKLQPNLCGIERASVATACFISCVRGGSFCKGHNIIAWRRFPPAPHLPLETIFASRPVFGRGYWLLSDQRSSTRGRGSINTSPRRDTESQTLGFPPNLTNRFNGLCRCRERVTPWLPLASCSVPVLSVLVTLDLRPELVLLPRLMLFSGFLSGCCICV